MCITKTKKKYRCFQILVLVLVNTGNLVAQDLLVKPLSKTSLNPLQTEIFLYAAGGTSNNRNLWTANNQINTKNKGLYGTYFDVGLSAEVYRSKKEWFKIGGSMGYKYEVYGFDNRLSANTGLYSHWMSLDLDAIWGNLCGVGIRSDVFLGSKIKNHDHFTHEGLYSDCFNKMAFCYYFSINIRLTKVKIEGRLGSYIKPQLNPDKISYFNMNKTNVNGLYFELRAYYRLFTTGDIQKFPLILE